MKLYYSHFAKYFGTKQGLVIYYSDYFVCHSAI